MVVDFDQIGSWAPKLWERVKPHLPIDIEKRLAEQRPDFVEDALDIILSDVEKKGLSLMRPSGG